MLEKIGFGGGCHWCTEAIFQSLRGVEEVQQGWITSTAPNDTFSEAVIVTFDNAVISPQTLVAIHLYTHSCTAIHSMRAKYRSAVYTTTAAQAEDIVAAIRALQQEYDKPIITRVLPYKQFKPNEKQFLDYYYSNPEKPFCKTFINPKLQMLLLRFFTFVDSGKISG